MDRMEISCGMLRLISLRLCEVHRSSRHEKMLVHLSLAIETLNVFCLVDVEALSCLMLDVKTPVLIP